MEKALRRKTTTRIALACAHILVAIAGVLMIVGSGTTQPAVRALATEAATATNAAFVARLEPICRNTCSGFVLVIENKTDKDLEIDWNRTLFLDNGTTRGGFMFEGVVFRDRNNPKPPDIVFEKNRFSKMIWPNNLVEFTSGRYGGWSHNDLPLGTVGVYLTVRQGQNELRERLTVTLSR
jgi:hypothetical protein